MAKFLFFLLAVKSEHERIKWNNIFFNFYSAFFSFIIFVFDAVAICDLRLFKYSMHDCATITRFHIFFWFFFPIFFFLVRLGAFYLTFRNETFLLLTKFKYVIRWEPIRRRTFSFYFIFDSVASLFFMCALQRLGSIKSRSWRNCDSLWMSWRKNQVRKQERQRRRSEKWREFQSVLLDRMTPHRR